MWCKLGDHRRQAVTTCEGIVFEGWIELSKAAIWWSEFPLGLNKRGQFLAIAAVWDTPSASPRSRLRGSWARQSVGGMRNCHLALPRQDLPGPGFPPTALGVGSRHCAGLW